ncbi:hypothetical protein SS50377_27813 [Spironucleus salmonicida]|uniref:Uncharacterized protein n=1 Tax=Spironucleus salmonicida TaxID=348837 RepID=V6LX90_9EUKA|nr:hypothetical protein SS50377_27813 [Spironucleus salmonicida]|eukprot:EST48868.1 hypothetical protein SS50377_10969 [Spironucleus salmonicida]
MESPLSRSVSNSLSQSGRKRVIKRVVVRKVRQTPQKGQLSPAFNGELFGNGSVLQDGALQASPVASPIAVINPLAISSREVSPLNSRALSNSRKPTAVTTSRSRPISRSRARGAQQKSVNQPDRFGTAIFAVKAPQTPIKHEKLPLDPLQTERNLTRQLQQQIDFLCDRELFDKLNTQIAQLQSSLKEKNNDISGLRKQLSLREKSIKSASCEDQFGKSLFEKLHDEIKYKNKENQHLKEHIKSLQNQNDKLEKRERELNTKLPLLFYKLTGENCEIDEMVNALDNIQQQEISKRMQCANLLSENDEKGSEIRMLIAEKTSLKKIISQKERKFEFDLRNLQVKNESLEEKLSQFSADYEELIKEYKNVVLRVQNNGSICAEESFDYGQFAEDGDDM